MWVGCVTGPSGTACGWAPSVVGEAAWVASMVVTRNHGHTSHGASSPTSPPCTGSLSVDGSTLSGELGELIAQGVPFLWSKTPNLCLYLQVPHPWLRWLWTHHRQLRIPSKVRGGRAAAEPPFLTTPARTAKQQSCGAALCPRGLLAPDASPLA